MEASTTLPPGAVHAPDLAVIQLDSSFLTEDFTAAAQGEEERELWFGPEPVHVSPDPADVVVREPQRDRWRDVLIRAALGTDAGVRLVRRDQAPKDGAGLILRWTTD